MRQFIRTSYWFRPVIGVPSGDTFTIAIISNSCAQNAAVQLSVDSQYSHSKLLSSFFLTFVFFLDKEYQVVMATLSPLGDSFQG